jgi:hypothetical protein
MITGEGRAVCDKEVGSPKRGWRACRRAAPNRTQSERVPYMTLHYCNRHSPSSDSEASR